MTFKITANNTTEFSDGRSWEGNTKADAIREMATDVGFDTKWITHTRDTKAGMTVMFKHPWTL